MFSEVHRINLLGSFLIASNVAAEIVSQHPPVSPAPEQDRGVIILTSSVSATEGQMGQVAYGSSKAAVEGLTLPMARDLARHGEPALQTDSEAGRVTLTLCVSARTCRDPRHVSRALAVQHRHGEKHLGPVRDPFSEARAWPPLR